MELTTEIKDKWVTALRSGEYKQGCGMLVSGDKYCCLGVLASICGVDDESMSEEQYLFGGGYTSGRISDKYRDIVPDIGNDREMKLSCMNDGRSTFSSIADYIEKNIEV